MANRGTAENMAIKRLETICTVAQSLIISIVYVNVSYFLQTTLIIHLSNYKINGFIFFFCFAITLSMDSMYNRFAQTTKSMRTTQTAVSFSLLGKWNFSSEFSFHIPTHTHKGIQRTPVYYI